MCGVTGILHFDPHSVIDQSVLIKMRDTMAHRGPDDAGLWIDGPVGLAHRRLSVIDLEGSHQPMGNASKDVWLSYNGEIYNFPALRKELEGRGYRFFTKGDTEVVLHAYEEYGTAVANHLEGMFALAIWDARRRRLFLCRDRFGIKPLYYAVLPWGIVFASEVRCLLAHPRIPRDLDWEALGLYLQTEYVPAPRSFFKAIRKLKAGHCLIVENGKTRTEPYWDLDRVKPLSGVDENEAAQTVDHLLTQSVKSMLVSDVPLGVFLSGGLDSSAIVQAACISATQRVKTFSVAVDDPDANEAPYAQEVARHFGTEHHVLPMTQKDVLESVHRVLAHLDEPLADASALPTYLLCEATRRHVTVALSGDGGDELFAGYLTHKAHRLMRYYQWLPRWVRSSLLQKIAATLPVSDGHHSLEFKIRKFLGAVQCPPLTRNFLWWGAFDSGDLKRILLPDAYEKCGPVDLEDLKGEYASLAGRANGLNRILLWDLKFYLQDDLLTKVDRMSMAHSLEVRVPFLDTRLVEYMSSLPANLKLRRFQSKYLLRKGLAGKIPPRILRRGKAGFDVPLARWLKGELREFADDCLAPQRIKEGEIFRSEEVARLVAEHRQGVANHRQKIWSLIVFEHWRRKSGT